VCSCASGGEPLDLEVLRADLRKIDDAELLRYGLVQKAKYSSEANLGEPAGEMLAKLRECRAEWKRRHPNLPLRDSISSRAGVVRVARRGGMETLPDCI